MYRTAGKAGLGVNVRGPITKHFVLCEDPQEHNSALFIHICMWSGGHDRKV